MTDADEPFLELAREIRREVERAAATGTDLSAAFEGVPAEERRRVARSVFDRLATERQWEVLAGLFDDDDLRAALRTVAEARRRDRLDLTAVPADTTVSLGLFRPEDVDAALRGGGRSTATARLLVVRTTAEPGVVHVLEDVFNPDRGLFVTPDYDEGVWRSERLAGHDRVRLGSLGPDGFEPVLYAGGRVDTAVPGRLHLGRARLDGAEVFAPRP